MVAAIVVLLLFWLRNLNVTESPLNVQQSSTNSDNSTSNITSEISRLGEARISRAPTVPSFDFDTPLNTEDEKQAFSDEAKRRTASELLSAWKEQLGKTNSAHLDFVEIALANKIKDNPDSDEAKEIYRFAANAFDGGALGEAGMMRLVKWLGQGGGASVVQLFLSWFDQSGNKEVRREILSQLTSTAGRASYSQNAESVSRILETRWHEAAMPGDLDSGLLPVLGGAIAKTGNPGGVAILLNEVTRGGVTRQQFESESGVKARLALQSLSQVRSEASVDVLALGMQQGSPDSMSLLASGEALASISKPATTKVLVDWARQADDACAPLAEEWLSRLRDYDSRKVVRYLFIESVSFRSEQVKQAVAAAIKSYD